MVIAVPGVFCVKGDEEEVDSKEVIEYLLSLFNAGNRAANLCVEPVEKDGGVEKILTRSCWTSTISLMR